ncbi:MAG: cysteine hydrolase [Coriobacteriales bacterium]|nr:cysteine hydrolase [Coriobacteriales bacterium]
MKVNNRYCSFYYEDDPDVGEIAINPASTALLVVDMQYVFVTRPQIDNPTPQDLKRAELWEQYYQAIDSFVIPNNKKILEAFRARSMDVAFARIAALTPSGRDRSLVQRESGFNDLLLPLDDPLGAIVPELAPLPGEIVFTKTTDSAVTGTNLDLVFRNMGIDTVVVTGVMTDQCVSGTVRALADRSFRVWLIEDACRAATQELQDAELTILNNIYCHVISTEELLEAL